MESYKNIIYELGKQLHLGEINADDEGYVGLTIDSHAVHLQYDEALNEIVIFTKLGEVEPAQLTDTCLMLLAANQFWQGTQGATLSMEPKTRSVFLAERQSLSLLNLPLFYEWLERFVNMACYWVQRLFPHHMHHHIVPTSNDRHTFFTKLNTIHK